MKKILITQRIDLIEEYGELRESIDQKLMEWLIFLDFIPILITNKLILTENSVDKYLKGQNRISEYLKIIKPDAIILTGGNNIGDYKSRDMTEYFLLHWAKQQVIPVLGICRGMQIMCTWENVKLKRVKGHVDSRHKLDMVNSNWPKEVNSYHDWAIENCPKDYIVKAKSKDKIIKAIKHKTLPWEGWMWHPEREIIFSDIDNYRIKKLFNN